MEKTIYLIDGSAYLHRAFHAIRSLSTSKGIPTNATFGFTRILLKLVKEKEPEYAIVFFDVKGPTFRHEMFEDYKANRPAMPEDMALQIPYIKKIVSAFNIPLVEKKGFEADDLIGTYARIAEEKGFHAVMVTGDKDFMQLVTDKSVIWDPMKEKFIDKKSIKQKFNLLPEQIIDMLGLCGDSADNIPGVPGVGPKTALKLLNEFSSMEGIYKNIESLKKKKSLYKKLTENKEQAFLSRKLVRIDKFAEVEENFEKFKLQPFDNEKLSSLFKELEFNNLYREFAGEKPAAQKNYKAVTKISEIKKLVKKLEKAKSFAVDTETTSKHPMNASLVGISFSYKENQGFYIPVGHDNKGQEEGKENGENGEEREEREEREGEGKGKKKGENKRKKIDQPDIDKVLKIIKPLLENRKIGKIGQNIKYDYIVFAKYGIKIRGIAFDTMIASYLVNPTRRGHSLDSIAMDLLDHKTIKYKDVTGKGKNQKGFEEIPIEKAVDYACEDADITFMASKILKKKLEERNLLKLLEEIEIPLISVLAKIEMNGIKIDKQKLEKLSEIFAKELAELEKEIFSMAGEEFNINSPKQLGKILFEKLKLPVQKKTKKKTGYSTDIDVLTKLAEDHDLPKKILRFRSIGKLKSTYSDSLQELIHPETGRIHTSFNQTITATGRLSSSDPNLQNIPVRGKEGKEIRQAFIPEKGSLLVSADYSQIELRILAHCAEDEILIDAFKNDEDIHTRTALEVFQVFPDFITDDLRRQAKAINFGIVYGMSSFGLAKELGISRKMAQTYIDNYFARYSGVKKFIDTTIEQTKKTCETSTLLGRKRHLAEINSSNANIRKFAQRAAINTPIQGSAADLIKLAMINMDKALNKNKMKSKMLISVHDEIVFEVPEKEQETLISLAKDVMENVFDLKVPLKVNIGVGANWAEAH